MSEIRIVPRREAVADTPWSFRRFMRRAVAGVFGFFLVSLALGIYLSGGRAGEVPAAAASRTSTARRGDTAGRTFTVHRGDIVVRVVEAGTVEPLKKVEVKSKVGGRVLRLLVKAGDHVRAGQVLSVLDPIEQESQVAQIRAQVAASRAHLSQAETEAVHERRTLELGIADAEKQLRAAQIRLDRANREAHIQPTLTRAAVAQAEADLRGARQALQRLNRAGSAQDLANAQAGYDQARAESDLADKTLARQKELLRLGFVPQVAVDEAERQVAAARARLHAAQTRGNTVKEDVDTNRQEAVERVARADAALAAARANAVQDALREDDVKSAQAGLDVAQVALRRARAQRSQVAVREAEVEAARAVVRQLENSLAEVETRLRDTTLRAPMAGIVTRRYVEEGELVTSGIQTFSSGTPVVQIADLSRMQVFVQVNEVDVANLRVGQEVTIELDASRGGRLPGRVMTVAPASAAPAASLLPQEILGQAGGGQGSKIVRFEVKIDILRADPRLRPGMTANVDIVTEERRGVLVLPLDAVDLERAHVKRRVGATVVEAPVTLGLQGDNQVEILSGLREGDEVVLSDYKGPPRRKLDLD